MDEDRFEEVEHTADIAIRVWGSTLEDLFANAAYGMACQLADVGRVNITLEREVRLQAADVEVLLVEWLGELLYLGERDDAVFVAFDVHEVTPTGLEAIARGGPMEEHHTHIKAVTFSELNIRKTDQGYETVVVFDV